MTEPVIMPAMEQESRLKTIVFEMQGTLDELLEKGLFALSGLLRAIDSGELGKPDKEYNIYGMTIQAQIVQDYILQAQKVIEDIVARECNDSEQQAMTNGINNKDDLEDRRQEIMSRMQKVRNPELITKILTYVRCWTDDEGGIEDER